MSREANRSHQILLALAALVLFGYRLGAGDIWTAAEGHHAEAAREMVISGHYLVPTIDGRPDLDRPPLYAWLVAACFRLSGAQDEVAVRLPAMLAATLCVLLIESMGRHAAGPRTGLLAAASLLVSVKFIGQARTADASMLLALWVTLAYWALHRCLDQQKTRYFVVFYLAAGMACLTKGIVGVLPILAPVTVYLAGRRLGSISTGVRRLLRARRAWALAPLGLVVAAPWYLVVWRLSPRSLDQLGPAVNFPSAEQHARNVLFYLYALSRGSLPMALVMPWALALPWRIVPQYLRGGPAPDGPPAGGFGGSARVAQPSVTRRCGRLQDSAWLAFCWLVVPLIGLSLWPVKQAHYLVPVLPALALLTGTALSGEVVHAFRWVIGPRAFFCLAAAVLLPIALIGAAVWLALHGLSAQARLIARWAPLTIAVGSLAAATVGRRPKLSFGLILGQLYLVLLIVFGQVMPGLDRIHSQKPFMLAVRQIVGPSSPLGVFRLHADSFFYLGRPVRVLATSADVMDLGSGRPAFVIVEQPRLSAVLRFPCDVVLGSSQTNDAVPDGEDELFLVRTRPNEIGRATLVTTHR